MITKKIDMNKEKMFILDTSPFIYYVFGMFCINKNEDIYINFKKFKLTNNLGVEGFLFLDSYLSNGYKFLVPTYVLVESINKIKNEKSLKFNKYFSNVLEIIPMLLNENKVKELSVEDSQIYMTNQFKYLGITDNFMIFNSNEFDFPVITSDKELFDKLRGNSILFA